MLSQKNPIKVYLKKSGKREIGGVCYDPRATEPLRETIAAYAASIGNPPVQIFLDGSEKNWRCFNDASGLCK